MRIAFICNEYPPRAHGGIGTFVASIVDALSRKGHELTVVELGKVYNERIREGVRVVTLPKNSIPFIGNLVSRLRLRRWLNIQFRNDIFDIVESPDYMGLVPFGLSAGPVVIRLHLSNTSIMSVMGKRPSMGIQFYEKRTLKANTSWIAVSRFSLELTRDTFKLEPQFTQLIYYPLPPAPTFAPRLKDLPSDYLLFAGTVSVRKGALVLAEAARPILLERHHLHLIYVGQVTLESDRLISDLILEILGPALCNRVHFVGHCTREVVLAYMAKATVFAFPSRLETLGIVVLEAMNAGVPIVSTSYPPGPEVIEHGVTGLLANPLSAEEFRKNIISVLDNPELARHLVNNATLLLKSRFGMNQCATASEQFYIECIQRRTLRHKANL